MSFDIGLVVQAYLKATTVERSPSLPPTNLKGKRAHSPSIVKKAKKSKGPSLPPDLILGPSKVPTLEAGVEDGMVGCSRGCLD